MASLTLTHVCMWSEHGWKRITAKKAARLHAGGTVSAHSGLFMCELCGQYVTLTDGEIRTRHFRHSAAEKDKDCPERTFGPNYSVSYEPQKHELPIRIVVTAGAAHEPSSASFRFELGLIRAPISKLGADFRVEIKPEGAPDPSGVFTKERLNCAGVTYLPLGSLPCEKYILSLRNLSDEQNATLRKFWPEEISGVDPDGTLFDKETGRKLTYDADVEINKEYYLLVLNRPDKAGLCSSSSSSIRLQEIAQKRAGWGSWTLYEVCASSLCEEAARFFLNFHCRLTDHPISLQLVWPLYVAGEFLVKHSQNNMFMLVSGNVLSVKTFPQAKVRPLKQGTGQTERSRLYEISSQGRQQLISVGRAQPLQYTYFWKEPLAKVVATPEISVQDLSQSEVPPGETDTLPRNGVLRFKSTFDGELIISYGNQVTDRRKIHADQTLELGGLSFGVRVQAVIGLDEVWYIHFKKPQSVSVDDSYNDAEIMKYISRTSGSAIPVPHALRNISAVLAASSRYPQLCQWLCQCIRGGTINEQSYRRLQQVYHKLVLQ